MTEPVSAPSPGRVLSRNAAFATVSAASAGLLLLLSALITRVLGEEVFGRFSWALRIAMLGEALMDFGVHQITIRSIARDHAQAARLFHNSLTLKAASGAVMLVVMGTIALAASSDAALRVSCLVMLLVAILRSYLLTVRGVLQGLERFGQDCLLVVGDRVLVLLLAGLAVERGAGLLGLVTAFLVARVLALGGALAIARTHAGGLRLSFDAALLRELQRQALPIGMFLVVLNFYSYIDTLMLGVLSTFVDTGLYSNAFGLYEGLSYAPAVLSAVLTPRLAQLWSTDRPRHRSLSRAAVAGGGLLAVVVAVPMWALSAPLLSLVFGPAAAAAVPALHLLLTGLAFVFVTWILHAVALSVFQERLLLRTTAIGAVANAALNFVLIPRYGRNGAAAATVLGELLTMALLVWGLRGVLRAGADRA
jgi:O-antigen/teichoic acid export membrane protein